MIVYLKIQLKKKELPVKKMNKARFTENMSIKRYPFIFMYY